jgi:hypothetical protein
MTSTTYGERMIDMLSDSETAELNRLGFTLGLAAVTGTTPAAADVDRFRLLAAKLLGIDV